MMPAGRFHNYNARVYYQDTDAGGVVYHARYANFAERARCEFLRDLGISVSELYRRDKILLVVKKMALEFLKAARLDDFLHIQSYVLHIGGASLMLRQNVYRTDAAGDRLAEVEVLLVAVCDRDGDFKPHALPQDLKQALTAYLMTKSYDKDRPEPSHEALTHKETL